MQVIMFFLGLATFNMAMSAWHALEMDAHTIVEKLTCFVAFAVFGYCTAWLWGLA